MFTVLDTEDGSRANPNNASIDLQWIDDLLRGKGCPECNHTSTSFVEQLLFLSLKNVLGEKEVLTRSKSVIGKELDIYIPKKQYAVEYGAWFWHKNRLKNDENYYVRAALLKNKLC